MKYGIGLDIGIASIGSCVMQLDDSNEPIKIMELCSRVFEKAEESDGSSLAASRRANRGIRRVLRRRRHRKERIKTLICSKMNVDDQYINNIYSVEGLTDIYQIRYEALDRRLEKDEFIRLLIHFSQRRGFKSNRKADAKNADSKSEEYQYQEYSRDKELRRKYEQTVDLKKKPCGKCQSYHEMNESLVLEIRDLGLKLGKHFFSLFGRSILHLFINIFLYGIHRL